MRNSVALCLTVLFGVTFPLSARAQHARPAKAVTAPCATEETETPSLPITAIVSTIDQRRGRATLETSVGQLELAAAPEELQALQTGMSSLSVSILLRSLALAPQRLPRSAEPAL